MGISEFLTVFTMGAAGYGFVAGVLQTRRKLREMNTPEPVTPKPAPLLVKADYEDMTVDDLLDCTLEPNLVLKNIESTICKKAGAKFDSDEADIIMEAVYDGHKWDEVREMCEGHLWTRASCNRIRRWV